MRLGRDLAESNEVRELHPHAESVAAVSGDDEGVGLVDDPLAGRQLELGVTGDGAVGRDGGLHEQGAPASGRLRLVRTHAVGVPLLLVDRQSAGRHVEHHPRASCGVAVDEVVGDVVDPADESIAGCAVLALRRFGAELVEAAADLERRLAAFELPDDVAVTRREPHAGELGRDRRVAVGADRAAAPGRSSCAIG